MAVSRLQRAQTRLAYLLVLPATLLILVIYIIPIILVFLASLTDYTLVSDYYEFVGFENYRTMFGDEVFANAVGNTFFYAALFLPGAFVISLILAIAIQEQKQFRSVLEVLYFLPVTSTLAAMAPSRARTSLPTRTYAGAQAAATTRSWRLYSGSSRRSGCRAKTWCSSAGLAAPAASRTT